MPHGGVVVVAEAAASAEAAVLAEVTAVAEVAAMTEAVAVVEASAMMAMIEVVKVSEGERQPEGVETAAAPESAWVPPAPGRRRSPTRAPIVTVIRGPIVIRRVIDRCVNGLNGRRHVGYGSPLVGWRQVSGVVTACGA